MLLNTAPGTDIVSSGVQAEGNFTFAINGKAFKVLSDTLYQDKIGSIVRETSCNAADSHSESGTPERPFEIHLPDAFEPWFSVKDYGVGMSHDTVMNVYTKFFESTKDQSNTQIGAFGLGSKTPFCYTDSFTVIAIHDGVKRSYSAMINEIGTPTIALLDETETTEHNGVEINIAVQTGDYSKFSSATSEQLSFFKVKPEVKNYHNFTFINRDTTNVILKDTNYVILKKNETGYHNRSQIFLVQGPVGYPLNYELIRGAINKISATPDNKNLSSFCEILLNSGAYLYFNIGDIEVTPSREAISYSERTINNIVARIQEVKQNYQKKVIADLNNLPNDWERAVFLNALGNLGDNFIDYTDRPFSKTQGLVGFQTNTFCTKKMVSDSGVEFYHKLFTVYNYSNSYSVGMSRSVINAKAETQIYYKDNCTYASKRVRLLHQKQKNPDLYVIEPTSDNANPLSIAELSALLGDVEILKVSDLPAPPREYSDRNSGTPRAKNTVVMQMSNTKFSEYICNWQANFTSLKELLESPAYYIEVESYKNNFNLFTHGQNEFINNLIANGKMLPIYLVNESKLVRVKNNKTWINLKEFIDKEYNNYVKSVRKNIRKCAFNTALNNWYPPMTDTDLSTILNGIPEYVNDPKIKFLNKLKARKNSNNPAPHKSTVKEHYTKKFNVHCANFTEKLRKLSEEFTKRFIILDNLKCINYSDDTVKTHITMYVKSALLL